MPKATIEIAGREMAVEYDFTITAHGSPGCSPSLNYPGDPPEPAEFEIEVLGLRFEHEPEAGDLEIPKWLKETIETHLWERDDINQIVQQADNEDANYNPDYD